MVVSVCSFTYFNSIRSVLSAKIAIEKEEGIIAINLNIYNNINYTWEYVVDLKLKRIY